MPADPFTSAVRSLLNGSVVQLGQPFTSTMPSSPMHPPFEYHLKRRHGEGPALPGQDPRISGAIDAVSMGLHCGTHMDNLSHCGLDGQLHDGTRLFDAGVQDEQLGIRMRGGEGMHPILAPGVLLDFCAHLGRDVVPDDYVITPTALLDCAERMGVAIGAGEVVLLRTGWDTLWHDSERFLASELPGPDLATAALLGERGILATGSDTTAYERTPSDSPLAVHAELLTGAGAFIMECLDLAELARRRAYRFLFVALPLRLPTATGSPINPIAILPD
jgi:kynurenine formamidase